MGRITRGQVGFAAPVRAAIIVGRDQRAHMRGDAAGIAAGGREGVDRLGDAVIGVFHGQAAAVAGIGPGHAPGDIVRLAARIDEGADLQVARQRRPQPFAVVQHLGSEIARVGVQGAHLARDGLDHMGMAVPDMRHVVIGVEIAAARGVGQPHALAPHHMQRRIVKHIELRPHPVFGARPDRPLARAPGGTSRGGYARTTARRPAR